MDYNYVSDLMENTQLTPFLTHIPFSALTSFLGIPLEAQTIVWSARGPTFATPSQSTGSSKKKALLSSVNLRQG